VATDEKDKKEEVPEETTANEPTPEEQREADRIAQNLPEGSVPEQRPTAMTTNDPNDVSDLTKRLRDAGQAPELDNEPMPQSAYDKAASDSQMKKAAKESVKEGAHPGSVVVATKGPHEGRVFAVTEIVSYQDVASLVRNLAGDPGQLYNSPKELALTAIGDERDSERLILNVEDNGLEKQNEGNRGTRFGRRH
jgi:hypothetical protein